MLGRMLLALRVWDVVDENEEEILALSIVGGHNYWFSLCKNADKWMGGT